MPELPEVETIARGVDRRLRNDRIDSVWFGEKRESFKSPPPEMAAALLGKRIARVSRVGKHIVFDLAEDRSGGADAAPTRSAGSRGRSGRARASGPGRQTRPASQWIVHLGMTGRLLVADPATPAPPHTHAILRLASGRELRFVDPRRFGRLSLQVAPEGAAAGFRGSGKEPLAISSRDFIALFRSRGASIKAALLDQKLLQGIGNIYADESLFRAGIRPRRRAARLTRIQLHRLHASLLSVLREAIALGGSSVSDYVDAEGLQGFFQLEHRVYMRRGLPCLVCATPIRRIEVAGRGTHYCPICQK
jgi:formamidopyrimidine-DNA glycosylase